MATKLSRKYDALTKFLRETIANEKISHRVRMSAAERLDGIYSKHLFYDEKAAARKERAEARALGIKPGTSIHRVSSEPEAPEPTAEELKERRMREEIDRILGRVPNADPRA